MYIYTYIYIYIYAAVIRSCMPSNMQRSSALCLTHAAVIRYMYTVLTCLSAEFIRSCPHSSLGSPTHSLLPPFPLSPYIPLSRYPPIPLSSLPGLDPSLLGLDPYLVSEEEWRRRY